MARSVSMAASVEADSTSPPPRSSQSAPTAPGIAVPSPPAALTDGATPLIDPAIAFAASEAARQAVIGATVETGASEVLRWASRRRTVLEAALTRLSEDDGLDAATQAGAAAILERALNIGLLF